MARTRAGGRLLAPLGWGAPLEMISCAVHPRECTLGRLDLTVHNGNCPSVDLGFLPRALRAVEWSVWDVQGRFGHLLHVLCGLVGPVGPSGVSCSRAVKRGVKI